MDNLSYTLTSYSGLPGCPSHLSSPQRQALFSRTESSSGVPQRSHHIYMWPDIPATVALHIWAYTKFAACFFRACKQAYICLSAPVSASNKGFNWKVVSENFLYCSMKILNYLNEMGNIRLFKILTLASNKGIGGDKKKLFQSSGNN